MSISVCSDRKERIIATVMSLSGMNGYSFHGMSHSSSEGYAKAFYPMAPSKWLDEQATYPLDDSAFASPKL